MSFQSYKIDRRRFLQLAAAGAGAAGLAAAGLGPRQTRPAGAAPAVARHGVWLWTYDNCKTTYLQAREVLARNNLAIMIKTHDGTSWQHRFDKSAGAINNGRDVARAVQFYGQAGVPVHAWCVVKGLDPVLEAEMCAEVIDAGVQSLLLDLEPPEGPHYWQADRAAALRFGYELRVRQPNAWIGVAPDARPWKIDDVPLAEFSMFCNEIAPQTYWETFDSPANHRYLARHGFPLPPAGLTPEFLLDVTQASLQRFGLPINPIGQGTASPDQWERFVSHGRSLGMEHVSVWRYGTASPGVFEVLGRMPVVAHQSSQEVVAPPEESQKDYEARENEAAIATAQQERRSLPVPRSNEAGFMERRSAELEELREEQERQQRKQEIKEQLRPREPLLKRWIGR